MLILEYKLVKGTVEYLNNSVAHYIKEGWQPYGNPYCGVSYQYQALVKYSDENEL